MGTHVLVVGLGSWKFVDLGFRFVEEKVRFKFHQSLIKWRNEGKNTISLEANK